MSTRPAAAEDVTSVGALFTVCYAWRVRADPERSLSYASAAYFRSAQAQQSLQAGPRFGRVDALNILLLFAGLVRVIWGVTACPFQSTGRPRKPTFTDPNLLSRSKCRRPGMLVRRCRWNTGFARALLSVLVVLYHRTPFVLICFQTIVLIRRAREVRLSHHIVRKNP